MAQMGGVVHIVNGRGDVKTVLGHGPLRGALLPRRGRFDQAGLAAGP
jgi:hypothetical protein